MNKILEEDMLGSNGSGQSGKSRCFFGDWPRRALLKTALPMKDWPRSVHVSEETMSTDHTIS
ncbi:hypothetical protein PJI16_14805 [Nitrospira sp. MA-1]|nr:hypothetical protein [Nitrospira sp. MA-1]